MEVQIITRYKYDGIEYNSPDKIKTVVENRLGVLIDNCDVTLNPKQKLNILKMLVENKTDIVNLLSVTIDTIQDCMYDNSKNILDY